MMISIVWIFLLLAVALVITTTAIVPAIVFVAIRLRGVARRSKH